MAGNLEIKEDGSMRALIGLRAIEGKKHQVRHLVNDAAKAASSVMWTLAPQGKTGNLRRRIDWDRAEYRPGGAGGGGQWVATAGVRAGDPYPSYVFRGTGLFGPTQSRITARPGNVMVIDGYKQRDLDFSRKNPVLRKARPGPIFTRSIKGQRPQTEWIEKAQDTAEWYIRTYRYKIFE